MFQKTNRLFSIHTLPKRNFPRTTKLSDVIPVNIVKAINKGILLHRLSAKKTQDLVLAHKDTDEEKLVGITIRAQDVLITANTIFPFVLFPGTISMDRQQLTIVHRAFFRTANTISVQIDDILNVESNVGPFFGSLHLFSKYFINNVQSISFLSRRNALKIQRFIQGYMIAHHRHINCLTIEKDHLVVLLNNLGQGTAK